MASTDIDGTFTITIFGKTTDPLPYTASDADIQNAIDKLVKEKSMKVPPDFNQRGTWRLSNEQLTIKVEVDSDNNIRSVASVAHRFVGQPLNNLVRWMNRISKTNIMLLKSEYRGHQYDPLDSEGLSGGKDKTEQGERNVRKS